MNTGNESATNTDLREPLQRETVATVGYRELVSLEIDATLADALQVMRERAVGCLVVVEQGALRGIFTERDVVQRVLGKTDSLDVPLRDFMTADPTTARFDEPIHQVLARMYRRSIRHVPVLDESGLPVGTMSVKRGVHFLADHYPKAVLNVSPTPELYPESREGG